MKNINFAFSLYKSGSSLFFGILKDICSESNRLYLKNKKEFLSVPNDVFQQGLGEAPLMDADFPKKYGIRFDNPDILYCGFRWVPAFFQNSIENSARIMGLIRDPRDVLVSHYFSMLKSHVVPPGESGEAMRKNRKRLGMVDIDDYMYGQISAEFWLERFLRLTELTNNTESRFWRYEDVIFEKQKWLDEILGHLAISLPGESKQKILLQWDILPAEENINEHIRKVTPGDHKEKLKASTIANLNKYFAEVLEFWNYD